MSTLNAGPGELAADAGFLEALQRAGATSADSAVPLSASTPLEVFRLARLVRIGRIHEAPPRGYFYDVEAAAAAARAQRVGLTAAVLMLLGFAALAFFLFRHLTS